MEPMATTRALRSSSYQRILLVGFGLLAVISPLYINQPETDLETDEQASNLAFWLLLLLILVIAFSVFILGGFKRGSGFSSGDRLVGIGFGGLAVILPLFVNGGATGVLEAEQESSSQVLWVALLLFVVVLAVVLCLCLDQSFTRFDPYWIHRVGGSSGGIVMILVILAIVLKFKAE